MSYPSTFLLPSGEIDTDTLLHFARVRGMREAAKAARLGDDRSISFFVEREYCDLLSLAQLQHEVLAYERAHAHRTPQQQKLAQLKFALHKAEHGLAMPYDAAKVARLRQEIAELEQPMLQAAE